MNVPGDDGGFFPDFVNAKACLAGNTQTNSQYHEVFEGRVGGVDVLSEVVDSFDLGLAIDVCGYLDQVELELFYKSMARIIKLGEHLVLMNENELLDMFAFNAATAAFFDKHFDLNVEDLLTESKSPRPNNAVRETPLSFYAEIAPYGFVELAQAFSQWHVFSPGMANRAKSLSEARLQMRDHNVDVNVLPKSERWKAVFRSSIFSSSEVKQ